MIQFLPTTLHLDVEQTLYTAGAVSTLEDGIVVEMRIDLASWAILLVRLAELHRGPVKVYPEPILHDLSGKPSTGLVSWGNFQIRVVATEGEKWPSDSPTTAPAMPGSSQGERTPATPGGASE